MRYLLIICFLCLWSVNAGAELRTETIEYKHGDTVLEGYLAYDASIKGKRPGILVVHEWWGNNAYSKRRAEQLARLGYVAFALDMYGKGVVAKDAKEAGALAGKYRGDRKLMRERANAGLEVLRKHELTDTKRMAAIGYCFGGTTILELARSGAPLAGFVSFHGGLDTSDPKDAANIKGKVLVLHGGDDPYVTAEQMAAFQDEMRKAGVDWQVVVYGGAVHSFTNPESENDKSKGVAYDEKADRRSWEAMRMFFAEIFK
ncbi:MAG: dienelactone hydrolase family protein [Deltaproteobacteria bacterium]|nr:dienelactone hydrolase family protein [Deltaproteobacteria bacterium]